MVAIRLVLQVGLIIGVVITRLMFDFRSVLRRVLRPVRQLSNSNDSLLWHEIRPERCLSHVAEARKTPRRYRRPLLSGNECTEGTEKTVDRRLD